MNQGGKLITLLVLVYVFAHLPATAAELVIENPRIRALIPGQNKTAAYFDITNEGVSKTSLIGVVSDSVGSIEIHTVLRDGDLVRMRRLSEVVLPPGKTVRFRSGGLHLMLLDVMDLQKQTEIQLFTSDGEIHRAIFQRISLLESDE